MGGRKEVAGCVREERKEDEDEEGQLDAWIVLLQHLPLVALEGDVECVEEGTGLEPIAHLLRGERTLHLLLTVHVVPQQTVQLRLSVAPPLPAARSTARERPATRSTTGPRGAARAAVQAC